jgi:hypothetical protein
MKQAGDALRKKARAYLLQVVGTLLMISAMRSMEQKRAFNEAFNSFNRAVDYRARAWRSSMWAEWAWQMAMARASAASSGLGVFSRPSICVIMY